jgi:hypothetical protein
MVDKKPMSIIDNYADLGRRLSELEEAKEQHYEYCGDCDDTGWVWHRKRWVGCLECNNPRNLRQPT